MNACNEISAWWLLFGIPLVLIALPVGLVVGIEVLARIGDWNREAQVTAPVERRHREMALSALHPGIHHLIGWAREWLNDGVEPDSGKLRRIAQALADLEQSAYERGLRDGARPFELLAQWTRGNKYRITTGPAWNFCDFECSAVCKFGPDECDFTANGPTPFDAALALCRELKLGDEGEKR